MPRPKLNAQTLVDLPAVCPQHAAAGDVTFAQEGGATGCADNGGSINGQNTYHGVVQVELSGGSFAYLCVYR